VKIRIWGAIAGGVGGMVLLLIFGKLGVWDSEWQNLMAERLVQPKWNVSRAVGTFVIVPMGIVGYLGGYLVERVIKWRQDVRPNESEK